MKKEYILVGILIVVYALYKKSKSTSTSPSMNTPSPSSSSSSSSSSVNELPYEKVKNIVYVNEIMKNKWNITSRAARIGILCTIAKESGFIPRWETGYSKTSNARIRKVFPTKTKGLTDEQLNDLKSTDEKWFSFIYGGILGNRPNTNDGYTFRGNGLNGLTGRANFEKYAKLSGIDILNNPSLNNQIKEATQIMLHFFYNGWDSAKGKAKLKAKGYNYVNDITDIDWAIRYFCSINAGNRDMDNKWTNFAYDQAIKFKPVMEKIILN